MVWVEKAGGQSWRVRYVDGSGHKPSVSGFDNKQAANDRAALMRAEQHRGVWIDPRAGQITVAEWSRRWLPSLSVAERTEENYRRDLRNYVLPRWGDDPPNSITTGEVSAWSAPLLAAGYSTATVSTQVKLLSRLLIDAVDAGLIAANPIHRRPRRGPRVVSPLVERVWTTPERAVQDRGENATALGGAGMGLLIITEAWPGTRRGEIAGLQRRNTHLRDGVILIDRWAGGLHESGSRMWLGPPKTSASIRVISLPPFLIDLLAEHLEGSDTIPVFAGPQGGSLRRSNADRRILRPAADGTLRLPRATLRLDPVEPGLTFMGCGTATGHGGIADGMPEIAQARRLGHHLDNRVVETYPHVAPGVEARLLHGLEVRWRNAIATCAGHPEPVRGPAPKPVG
jgi:integrase